MCVVKYGSQRRAYHSSRGVLPSVMCPSVIVKSPPWGGPGPIGISCAIGGGGVFCAIGNPTMQFCSTAMFLWMTLGNYYLRMGNPIQWNTILNNLRGSRQRLSKFVEKPHTHTHTLTHSHTHVQAVWWFLKFTVRLLREKCRLWKEDTVIVSVKLTQGLYLLQDVA